MRTPSSPPSNEPPAADVPPWHAMPPDRVLAELGSDAAVGLSADEAARRAAEYGLNEIPEAAPRTVWRMLATQFADVMILVLLGAAAVSGLVGELADTIAILVIVVLNATVGAIQEYRAERAIAALRKLAAPIVRVVRDGAWFERPAIELVPGDVIRLHEGDVVCADVRLLRVADLHVDEAALTGESETVAKHAHALHDPEVTLGDRRNMAFRGTVVTSGRSEGVVVATGTRTELGRIAALLHRAGPVRTPLQIRLAHFGRVLALAVLAICALIFGLGMLRGEPVLVMLLTALSLAVAAIPEALPAMVTASLALGARKMVKRNALIRRLPAVETLGSVTYVCADKTGTLTENRMRADAFVAAGARADRLPDDAAPGSAWDLLLHAVSLNNDATPAAHGVRVRGDPTELALCEAASAAGAPRTDLEREQPRVGEVAFDSTRKRMTTVHRAKTGATAYVKGAPEVVLELCRDAAADAADATTPLDAEAVLADARGLADEGYRVLAFAARRLDAVPEPIDPEALERELTYLGLVALFDPPRETAAESVALCRSAGITPVMITGDHPGTARAISRRLGILDETGEAATTSVPGAEDGVLTGVELEQLSPEQLTRAARATRVYARVSPEQKISIVRALRESGEFVAMTGDGVNDAPALQSAEIGVAMGKGGTEVAREAADMVLLDDDFSTIVAAIREGRRVFDNIRKFVKYTLTSNAGEIWTLLIAPLVGLPLPLLPLQILWINLVTDGLPGLALAAEPEERGIMTRPPRPPSESIFAHGLGHHALWMGLLIGALSLGGLAWSYGTEGGNWRSVVFTVLTFSQLAHVLVIRSERDSLFTQGLLSNLPLLGAVLLTVLLQLAVVYVPWLQAIFHTSGLTGTELVVCLALPLVVVIAGELEKLVARRAASPA